jgi:hypothetical protein
VAEELAAIAFGGHVKTWVQPLELATVMDGDRGPDAG